MRIKNLIFDFDGTITDSKRDIASAQLWALQRLGVAGVREEDLYRHIGKSLHETFAAILPDSMHHLVDEAAALYAEHYPPRSLLTTVLFPGVRETLEELVRRGKRLAVASTKRGAGIHRATDHFGITQFFDQLQGSDGLPFKPDPAVIQTILQRQGWDPGETIMVGDTDKDILAGRNAGLRTVAVTYGSLSREELSRESPDWIVDAFPDLLSIAP